MLCENQLLPVRRVLAAALSVAALGMVSPAWAHPTDDDDSGDKKEVRVYRMGGDDDESAPEERSGESGVYRYKVERADAKGGYLGVRVQDITRALRQARDLPTDEGALVNRVEDESPADDAGIQRGDVIVEVNRRTIKDSDDLITAMQGIEPGSKAEVVLIRDGLRKTVKVDVAKRPRDMMMVAPGFRWRSDRSMDPEEMRQLREKLRHMDPEKMQGEMRMMMPGPEFRDQMDQLREQMDQLREQIRELREELRESRDEPRGSRSGS
ncbi:MAG TPA: PDZ domain-containing protein [Candidatus Eisenbacteria bacterium]|nr:PDZ domain-containing protein [Candidatus Eisenbacteria bacterium]